MNKPIAIALCLLLPFAAGASLPASAGNGGIDADMAAARKEVREELAKARAELETENIDVGNSLHFGKPAGRRREDTLPRAEITPRGDFLVDGRPVTIDAGQRRELLDYRRQVIDIAKAGIDIGERTAQAALETVDRGVFRLMLGALSGGLERNIEKTVKANVEPGVRRICQRLPELLASQQRLAASLPAFRPYATLERDDIDDCEDTLRREFASR